MVSETTDHVSNLIPVVTTSDNLYSKALAVCLRSILEKTSAFIDFIVLSDNISKKNIKKIKASIKQFSNFKLSFVGLDKFDLKQFPQIARFPVNVFARYFIPEICKKYDRVIYTDADVVFNGDIAEYYKIDLDGKGIAAAPEECGLPRPGKYSHQERKRVFGIEPTHTYFANGNLIIDCDYWRKHNITDKLIKKTNELKNNLICPDLDVMNVVFQNNYKKLHFKYCATIHRYTLTNGDKEMQEGYNKPFIIHYSDELKPWDTNKVVFFKEWYEIYKRTAYYSILKNFFLFLYRYIKTTYTKLIILSKSNKHK